MRVAPPTRMTSPRACGGRHASLSAAGKGVLGPSGGVVTRRRARGVMARFDAVALLEWVGEPVDDAAVVVVAAEVGVAVGRLHLDHALAALEHGDVEGPPAEVPDQDLLVRLLV